MVAALNSDFISLKTNEDGYFNVTITNLEGKIIFSEKMLSRNRQIILKGFSLKKNTVILSPLL